MDINNNSLPRSRYPYIQNHYHSQIQRSALPIDVQAIVAGVQRYPIPQTYIPLPPGVDPASVDYRTFFPYNPSEVKHRKRTTRSQLKVLEDTFKCETKPNATLRKSLAAQLEMTPRGVQVWFQNRRAKEKALAKKVSSSDRKSLQYDKDADCDNLDDEDDDETFPAMEPEETEQASLSAIKSPHELTQNASIEVQSLNSQATRSASADRISAVVQDIPVSEEFERATSSFGTPKTPWQSDKPFAEPPTNAQASSVSNLDINSIINLRRGSLPTHFGLRTGFEGGAGLPPSSYRPRSFVSGVNGSVGPGGLIGFDPLARRLSLDRLASHPYARVAIAANSAVYGPSCTRVYSNSRLSVPTRTPTQVVQASIRDHGLYDNAPRSDLTHQVPVTTQFQLQGQTGSYSPENRTIYTSTRTYQEPIPGPLPEPNFSFGTVQIPSSMDADDNINNYGNFTYRENGGDLEDVEEDQPSAHNFYSRFGSMASIADSETSSVGHHFAEGNRFNFRPNTSHSLQEGGSLNNRRLSCNGQMLDMFTHLGVENGSNSSLQDISSRINGPDMIVSNKASVNVEISRETPGDYSSPSSSTVSGGSNDNNSVPISQSSELTYALQHAQKEQEKENDGQQSRSIIPDGLGDVVSSELNSTIDSESRSFQNSHRSSMSSSGSSIIYPLSASSSQTSLSLLPPRPVVDMPDNFLFNDGIEVMPMEAQHTFSPHAEGRFISDSDATGQESYQFTPDTHHKEPATSSFASEACDAYQHFH